MLSNMEQHGKTQIRISKNTSCPTYISHHVPSSEEEAHANSFPKAQTSTIYCPPFDHPDIWQGNSTVMHEIATQMPGGVAPDVLICWQVHVTNTVKTHC
jgi:threonine dehydratase